MAIWSNTHCHVIAQVDEDHPNKINHVQQNQAKTRHFLAAFGGDFEEGQILLASYDTFSLEIWGLEDPVPIWGLGRDQLLCLPLSPIQMF